MYSCCISFTLASPVGYIYSLLKREEGEWAGVRMHGLVQWWAMKYEGYQPWDLWHLEFVLAACHQVSEDAGRPQFRRHIVAHIPEASLSHLKERDIKDEGNATAWGTISEVYHNEGRWKEAEELRVRTVETRKRLLREEHPSTLTSMAKLASTYRNQGRWKEAEQLQAKELKICLRVLGSEHPSTLTSLGNLASTFWN